MFNPQIWGNYYCIFLNINTASFQVVLLFSTLATLACTIIFIGEKKNQKLQTVLYFNLFKKLNIKKSKLFKELKGSNSGRKVFFFMFNTDRRKKRQKFVFILLD